VLVFLTVFWEHKIPQVVGIWYYIMYTLHVQFSCACKSVLSLRRDSLHCRGSLCRELPYSSALWRNTDHVRRGSLARGVQGKLKLIRARVFGFIFLGAVHLHSRCIGRSNTQ